MIPKDDGEDGETTTPGFLCPFWFLEYTDDPKEVNMEIHGNLVNYNQCNKKIDEVTIKIPVARMFLECQPAPAFVCSEPRRISPTLWRPSTRKNRKRKIKEKEAKPQQKGEGGVKQLRLRLSRLPTSSPVHPGVA